MAQVRVVWSENKNPKKRAGLKPKEGKTIWLSQGGVPVPQGVYLLVWMFLGEVGETISLKIEQGVGGTWTERAETGPHKISQGNNRVDSIDARPKGYVDIFVKVT